MKSIKMYVIIVLLVGTTIGCFVFMVLRANKTQKNNRELNIINEIISEEDKTEQITNENAIDTKENDSDQKSSEETTSNESKSNSKSNSTKKNNSGTSSKNTTITQTEQKEKETSSNSSNNSSTTKTETVPKVEKKCYPRQINVKNTLPSNQITEIYANEDVKFSYSLSNYCYYNNDGTTICGDVGCTSYDDTVTASSADPKVKVSINNANKILTVNHTSFNSTKVTFMNKKGEEIGKVKFGAGCRPITSITSKISEIKLDHNKLPQDLKYIRQSDFIYTGSSNCDSSHINYYMSIDDTSIADFQSEGIGIYSVWNRAVGTTTGHFKLCSRGSSGCGETTIKIIVY